MILGVKPITASAGGYVFGSAEAGLPEGLEPPTYCLEGNCSIQLSYGQTNGAHNKVRIILRACIRETLSVLLCRGVMGAWLRILAV